MKLTREIIARPKDGDDIRDEFFRFLEEADEKKWGSLGVLFGFAWGNYAYVDNWIEEELNVDELRLRVQELEGRGDGSISEDDLFVTVGATGIQHTFCHENDIHIEGALENDCLTEEAARFRSLGWGVHDRTKTSEQNDADQLPAGGESES